MSTREPRPAGSPPRPARRRTAVGRKAGRRTTVGVFALVAASVLAGCGIRGTAVPVKAEPAPTRVACALEGGNAVQPSPEGGTSVEHLIALVCSGRVVDVRRELAQEEARPPSGTRYALARGLLAELRKPPSDKEHEAGFTSDVPEDLELVAPRPGDDSSALRLSRHPNELPSFTLAQVICTFADTTLGDANRQVLLGGPDNEPNKPLKLYECGTALRTTVETAETAGVPF